MQALLLILQCLWAKCKTEAGVVYTADYNPGHGLEWHHSAREMEEHSAAAALGVTPPLPTASDIKDALSSILFQSMETFVARKTGNRESSSRKLLMKDENLEEHPAAQPKPSFLDSDRHICDKDMDWAEGQYEKAERKFNDNYKWWTSFNRHFFFGTDEIVLKSFDGAIIIKLLRVVL